MRGRGDIWETAISETRNFQQVQENHKTGRGNSPFSRAHPKLLIQLDLFRWLVEAAGVEPVPVHFLTGDGARLPWIPAVNPLRFRVPCSPLESPPVVETFGRRDPTLVAA